MMVRFSLNSTVCIWKTAEDFKQWQRGNGIQPHLSEPLYLTSYILSRRKKERSVIGSIEIGYER